MPKLFVVAGEASGDAHAGRMLKALKQHRPDISVSGIGGETMREAGVDIITDFAELAVMGLVEVIKRYSHIKAVFDKTVEHLASSEPDALILVDYPGFNLKLAKKAHELGIPVIYYISPKIWAWRAGRIKAIKRYVDLMLVLFPFEQSLYEKADVAVKCVGHPLVDAVHSDWTSEQAKSHFSLDTKAPVLGLFPGSRRSEVEALLPVMLATAEHIQQRDNSVQVILPLAPGLDRTLIEPYLSETAVKVEVISGEFYDVVRSCDAIVAASGTVTLEIALLGVPHLITYRVAPLTYQILKRLVKIPYVGLCNIVTGKNVVTELLQSQVSVAELAPRLLYFLTAAEAQQQAHIVQEQVLKALGPSGGADNAARAVISFIDTHHS